MDLILEQTLPFLVIMHQDLTAMTMILDTLHPPRVSHQHTMATSDN
jgi:hypothetical protein